MTVANQSFSDGFVSLISQFHGGTLNSTSFAAQLLTLVDSWNGGSVSNAKLSNDINSFVGNQRVWQKELRDWWAGTVTGGPSGNGLYPFTNDLGVVSYAPCPALLQNPVLGPAGQASNAAATAWTAANTSVAALNNIGNALSLAQASANAAASNATIAVGNATSAIAANTSAWTARAGASASEANALTYRNTAQTYATYSTTNATIAVGNATVATTKAAEALASATNAAANATIATTKAGEALTSATNAAANATITLTQAGIATSNATSAIAANTSAWTARAGAATAQTNAETANTNAWTAKNAAGNSATTAAANAVIATTKAGEALTSANYAAANATTATTQAGLAISNATSATLANTSAWTAKAGATASELAALGYRDNASTYATYSLNNATIAVGNATIATTAANTATTRAVAAETAQIAAETARQQTRDYANAAALSAANAAAATGFNIADYQLKSAKGTPNGYAGLDGNGKIPASQFDASILGAMTYVGVWNASTNSPTIATANTVNKGQFYKVSTAGTTNVSGIADWQVGDWIVSNGSGWDKIDNTDSVTSVAGRTGVVTLTKADVGLSSVDNTTDLGKPISTATQAALDLKLNIASKATTTEALVGSDDTKFMTPLKTAQAIVNAVTVTSVAGRTGAIVLAKADVGLSNVDNTTDLGKPISNAVATALAGKVADGDALKYDRQVLVTPTISGGALTLDLSQGAVFSVSWNANITSISVTNCPTGSVSFTLILTGAGGTSVSWNTTTFKFPGGTAPTLVSTAGVMNYLTLHTLNQGTRVNVFFSGAPI